MIFKKKAVTKTEGLLNSMDLYKKRYKAIYWCMYALLMVVALCCLLPILWMALSSFKETSELYSIPPTLFPEKIQLGKIVEVWQKVRFGKYLINTLIIITGCLVIDIMLSGLTGYVITKVKPTGYKVLDKVMFWTMMMPGISMVPLYMTFVDLPILHINLRGTFFPLWMMAGTNAFHIFLFRNFFNGIPDDYFEAAKIDGCGNIRMFFSVILPLSKPILAVVTIFSVTGSWSSFMWPYLMLGNSKFEPLSVLLYMIEGSGTLQDNQIMMLMLMVAIPPLVFYALFNKQIVGGVNMSGIKG